MPSLAAGSIVEHNRGTKIRAWRGAIAPSSNVGKGPAPNRVKFAQAQMPPHLATSLTARLPTGDSNRGRGSPYLRNRCAAGPIVEQTPEARMAPSFRQQCSLGAVCSSSRRGRPTRRRGFERLEDRSLFAAFTVNSLFDNVDANPGNGVAQDAAGRTTLRAAIMEANALTGDDTINLPAGAHAVFGGRDEDAAAAGDLDIAFNGRLTITGTGAEVSIIDAGTLDRVFHVLANANVSMSGITIRNGNATSGGGILNAGTLTISSSVLSENAGTTGGGINNVVGATLTITDTTISSNGRNLAGRGGGIYNSGDLAIFNCTIVGNNASSNNVGEGGGIFNSETGTATIASSTIRSNVVAPVPGPRGGGIYNLGTLTVTNSAITENSALVTHGGGLTPIVSGVGGGIYNGSATMSITNTTISGNSAASGGGVYNTGQMSVKSSTITNNTGVPYRLNPFAPGGVSNRGTLTLQNSIIAQNISPSYPNFDGIVTTWPCSSLMPPPTTARERTIS